MKKLRAWLAYCLYALIVTAVCVYFLFPAEAVSRYIVGRAAAVSPDVQLSIGHVSPLLPPGLKLQRVTIAHYSGGLLEASVVRLYPRWLSLLGSQPSVAYSANAGRGVVRGTVAATGPSARRQVRIDADLDAVRLQELGALQPIADYNLEGAVSGRVRFSGGSRWRGDLRLTVTDLRLAPPRPVLGIDTLRFESVAAQATLENRNLKIHNVTLAGEQVSGELTGNLVFGRRLMDSTLSLTGTIRLNLRAESPGAGSRPGAPGGADMSLTGKVPVQIQGTLANPRVSLQ